MITVEKETATLSPVPLRPPHPGAGTARVRQNGVPAQASPSAGRRRPMARQGLRPVRRAQDFGWRSPEAAAVLVASICVPLACFYVAAYARVASEGFEAAHIREEMKKTASDKEALEAEIARLTLPATVKARAVQLGMVQATSQTVRVVTPACA